MQCFAPFLILLAFVVVHSHNVGFAPEDLVSEQSIHSLFERWCIEHGKFYSSESEKELRYGIFKSSLEAAHAHNSQTPPPSYVRGLNAFSDITNEEFHAGSHISGIGLESSSSKIRLNKPRVSGTIPDSIDWRTKGAVTSVKDVGNCTGGTWAFAVAGAVEAVHHSATGQLIDLSAQQILDCSSDYGGKQCTRGAPQYGLWYLNATLGIYSETAYPFTAQNKDCEKRDGQIVSIDGLDNLWSQSEESEIAEVVAKQPVTALIDGNTAAFKDYKGGIFSGPCSEDTGLTTGVLIVGYGALQGTEYWIIKNSWGSSWGENGYMRLERGVARCGINSFIFYPTKKANPSATIQQGLVAWWKLDQKSGKVAVDSSPLRANGNISCATWNAKDKGLEFKGDGIVSFGTRPSLAGRTPFSLSVWVKAPPSQKGYGVIIQQRGADLNTGGCVTEGYSGQYQLCLYNGKPYVRLTERCLIQARYTAPTKVNDNKWHHIVAVRDGREVRIYVDGALSGSTRGEVANLSSNIPVNLGKDARSNLEKFIGVMAGVRIYDRVLTVEEIKLLFELKY